MVNNSWNFENNKNTIVSSEIVQNLRTNVIRKKQFKVSIKMCQLLGIKIGI